MAMADADSVVNGIESMASMVEQFGKAFTELENHRDASDDKFLWKEIEEHFRSLEQSLKKKFEELEEKEKVFEEKESETRALIVERESVVSAKEQDLLDRVQELKDTAVDTIAEARARYKPPSPEPVVVGSNEETKVSNSLNGDASAPLLASEGEYPHRTGEHTEGIAVEIEPCPELTQFCEQMDAKGLLNFIMENPKKFSAMSEQISTALKSASEPARLVLDSLEGFFPPDQTTQQGDNSDAALLGMRRSCVMLMEALGPLLASADPGADHHLSPETKQQAKAIADEWKPKLAGADVDAANGNSLEAVAFLQLLATFRIASEFDEEELCKLVLAVAHLRQAPELCRSLGLTHKMPGIVEELINNGKQIEAVHVVQAFQLSETFPPVPLLKTYLKDLRRSSQGKGAGEAAGAQIDANAQELAALRSVIKCVEEYKLEAEYPLDPLQKRLAQLEKSKTTDKKRMGEVKYQTPKRGRPNGGYYGFHMHPAAASRHPQPFFGERGAYTGVSEIYPPPPAPTAYDYQAPGQAAYGLQANAQRSYYYPQEEKVNPTASYNAVQSNYGGYMGSAVQPPHQPYM